VSVGGRYEVGVLKVLRDRLCAVGPQPSWARRARLRANAHGATKRNDAPDWLLDQRLNTTRVRPDGEPVRPSNGGEGHRSSNRLQNHPWRLAQTSNVADITGLLW